MWLAFYNSKSVGDVLMLQTQGGQPHDTQSFGDVTVIYDEAGQAVGVNLFHASSLFTIDQEGPVQLTDQQVQQVNERLAEKGVDVTVNVDNTPKFVVGYVESCEAVEGSDHLSLTQTNVGSETLQIVCGAKNVREGLHVLVAKPGAVMPDGLIIWPGELRGVKSEGMLSSTRELQLPQFEQEGIWEVPEQFEPGTALEDVLKELEPDHAS